MRNAYRLTSEKTFLNLVEGCKVETRRGIFHSGKRGLVLVDYRNDPKLTHVYFYHNDDYTHRTVSKENFLFLTEEAMFIRGDGVAVLEGGTHYPILMRQYQKGNFHTP